MSPKERKFGFVSNLKILSSRGRRNKVNKGKRHWNELCGPLAFETDTITAVAMLCFGISYTSESGVRRFRNFRSMKKCGCDIDLNFGNVAKRCS